MSLLLGLMNRGEYSQPIEDEFDQLVAAIQTAFNSPTGDLSVAGPFGVALDLTVGGDVTVGGEIFADGITLSNAGSSGPPWSHIVTFTATLGKIAADTEDGFDTKALRLSGGGGPANDSTRGGSIILVGNDAATTPGWIRILPGIPTTQAVVQIGTLATQVFINEDANANNLQGLTINQWAADDHLVSGKSTDVATGLTTAPTGSVETDDYLTLAKFAAATGGLLVQALGENAAVTSNLVLESYGGQADTTKSTSGRALIELYASQHNGSNALSNIAADGNVFGVRARVGAADTTVAIVDEDGDLWLNGGLTINGGRVGFPATQVASADANTLDDYEEGTWTPVIGGSTSESGQTYGTQVGHYVKIGQLVLASFLTTFTAKGTITGTVRLKGLPFSAVSAGASIHSSPLAFVSLNTNQITCTAIVLDSSTAAVLRVMAAAATTNSGTDLATTDLTDTSSFQGTIVYRASA